VAEGRDIRIDREKLSEHLGVPVVETVGRKGGGTKELVSAVLQVLDEGKPATRPSPIDYGSGLERIIAYLQAHLVAQQGEGEESLDSSDEFIPEMAMLRRFVVSTQEHEDALEHKKGKWNTRWLILRLLEEDRDLIESLGQNGVEYTLIDNYMSQFISRAEDIYEDDIESVVTERIYAYVKDICNEVVDATDRVETTLTDKVDHVLTSPMFGLPIFALMMYVMFEATFTLGAYPMDLLDMLFTSLGVLVTGALPAESLISDLIVNGVIGGVGGVIVFLPNIILLFLFISVFEDSGYMARVAFLMDRLMHGIGLHGKSFISLITGFGCNVPGVMAARTLENEKDRLVTILINPFMSCSARLPVYILFCGAFFPDKAGLAIFGIYILGIAVAVLSGKILRLTVLKGGSAPFVMELPPYRVPTARSLVMHMWERASLFLTKAGTIVLCGVVVMWGLNTFPRSITTFPEYDAKVAEVQSNFALKRVDLTALGANFDKEMDNLQRAEVEEIEKLEIVKHMDTIKQRYAGRIGSFLEPIIRPFGFDWRVAVSLIPGFAAKEIVVGSLGVLYQVGEEEDAESKGLQEALRQSDVFTPFRAVLFMIFTLLYVPCLATIATIKRETNSWKWPFFSIAYSMSVAWIVTYVVMVIGTFIGLH
ncbi:MAG: ferrous iron transport protein B, partial [Candidatus Latescibacteria bacterium]|nr:ferrous iron transport protein B [Candidatus Latescibacterota bacterium]